MSRDALRDAFVAGWNIGKSMRWNGGGCPDKAFNEWYQRAFETLDRAPVPICPDNSHDYRVDDLLKCATCGKVLF